MADIMASLVLPKQASQESFHSTQSHSSQLLPNPGPAVANAVTLQDVDAFLDECQNRKALLDSKAKVIGAAGPKSTPHDEAQQPVPIGQSRSSQYIQTLHYLCQQRGIVPEFEIDGDNGDFGGWLKINEHNIGSDRRWPSKKAVREGLAENAIEIVKSIQVGGVQASTGNQINWVGKLMEYYAVATPPEKPMFYDYAIGNLFACECVVPGREQPYGRRENGFPNKKAARASAAKEAVENLISEGLLNQDGTIKAKKKIKVGTAVRVEGKALNVQKSASYSQKVTDFCPILGLTAPTYHFSVASADAPNLLSGFASFPGSPNLPSKVGEVRNVFGKKNAKEECARGIWRELKALARTRGVEVADSEEE